MLAIEAIILAILAVPLSRIGTRRGPHRAVFLGIIWVAAALWLLTYSRAIFLVYVSAGLIGLGFVLALPAWLAFITEIAPQHRKGEVLGVIGFSQGVGMLIGSSLAGVLFAREGFTLKALAIDSQNLPFFLAGTVLAGTAALSYFWIYRRKMREG